jgi:hypothetical protein
MAFVNLHTISCVEILENLKYNIQQAGKGKCDEEKDVLEELAFIERYQVEEMFGEDFEQELSDVLSVMQEINHLEKKHEENLKVQNDKL